MHRRYAYLIALVHGAVALLGGAVSLAQAPVTLAPSAFAGCGTPDPELREVLYGFPFDPGDCSATSTNPTPDYDPGVLYEIPVVVHIIMDDSCTQGAMPDALVHSQIEILNEDYLALPGTNGENGTDTQIRFVLASEDPDGKPTTGITRDCNTAWYNDDLTSEYWNELAWDPHNYLNLYTNTAGNARGYVPFLPADGGGDQVGEPHDRVVVNHLAFGRRDDGPVPAHLDGRTATHEIGHYLGLLHPFLPIGACGAADPPGCYEEGDLICDTAAELNAGDKCPKGAESCGSLDPITNYMDYTDDLCMEEFTLEQSRRLRCTLSSYRPDLYNVVEPAPDLAFDPTALDFGEVEVGSSSPQEPLTLTNTGDADATGLDFMLTSTEFTADTSLCGPDLAPDASCSISVTFSPTLVGPAAGELVVTGDEEISASMDVVGHGASETEVFTAVALAVDTEEVGSDGNGVLEPGEIAGVAPTWRNDGIAPQALLGVASDFTGPAGASYTVVEGEADYGGVAPGGTATCLDGEGCYELGLSDPAVRPATLWEATFEETLSDQTTRTWSLHIGDSFTDVPRSSPFYTAVETLLQRGVTGGCAGSDYCPAGANSRGQMPAFVLKALEGSDYTPPACAEDGAAFGDVPFDSAFCPWIQELAKRGIVSGCGDGNYCPASPVTRAQMAIFLLKTLEGDGYSPPECSNRFTDVPCPSLFADWIEELAAREITGGCTATEYCPGDSVSRAQMAAFVTRTFELTLYGP